MRKDVWDKTNALNYLSETHFKRFSDDVKGELDAGSERLQGLQLEGSTQKSSETTKVQNVFLE